MSINKIQKALVQADKICDYIPIVSTVSNIVDLVAKCVLKNERTNVGNENYYHNYLRTKSVRKCILGSIPFLGNSILLLPKIHRAFTLLIVFADPDGLSFIGEESRNDKKIVLAAVKKHPDAFVYASNNLKNDREFVLEVIKHSPEAFKNCGHELRNDREIVLASVKKHPGAFVYASNNLKNDREFVLEVIKHSSEAFKYCGYELRNDREFVLEVIKHSPGAIINCGDELSNDKEFMLAASEEIQYVLHYVGWRLAVQIYHAAVADGFMYECNSDYLMWKFVKSHSTHFLPYLRSLVVQDPLPSEDTEPSAPPKKLPPGLEDGEVICPITLEPLEDNKGSSLPCGHIFNTPEIINWLQGNYTCPCCRRDATVSDLEDYPFVPPVL